MPFFKEKSKYSDNALLWGYENFQKGLRFRVQLTLEDNEEFDIKNLFIKRFQENPAL